MRYVRKDTTHIIDTEKNDTYFTDDNVGAGGWNILDVVNRQDKEIKKLKKEYHDHPDLLRENILLKQMLALVENDIKFVGGND